MMRSGRQIGLLLYLQTGGGTSAPELAAVLGVSLRTIYRDVEQLAEAGVPIYAERGNGGGIRLVEGYRTRLTGLDRAESEALSLAGWSTVADALGVGPAAAGAERKRLAAIPPAAAIKRSGRELEFTSTSLAGTKRRRRRSISRNWHERSRISGAFASTTRAGLLARSVR